MTFLYLMYRLRPADEEKVEMHKSYSKQVHGKIQKKKKNIVIITDLERAIRER